MTSYIKYIYRFTLFVVMSFSVCSCATQAVLPSDSAFMNIWVSPEYLSFDKGNREGYLTVVVTGVEYLPTANDNQTL